MFFSKKKIWIFSTFGSPGPPLKIIPGTPGVNNKLMGSRTTCVPNFNFLATVVLPAGSLNSNPNIFNIDSIYVYTLTLVPKTLFSDDFDNKYKYGSHRERYTNKLYRLLQRPLPTNIRTIYLVLVFVGRWRFVIRKSE